MSCVFSANQSGETALDVARRLKNSQCEEPVGNMTGDILIGWQVVMFITCETGEHSEVTAVKSS